MEGVLLHMLRLENPVKRVPSKSCFFCPLQLCFILGEGDGEMS